MFVFADFKKNVKIWRRKEVSTSNAIFMLHHWVTVVFLLACMVIVSSRQFIKEHINCISDKEVAPVINTFCFFSTTYTVVKYHNESYRIGTHSIQAGVGPWILGDEIKQHAYYQWVPFVLLFQAALFYAPHMLWKKLEKGRLSVLVNSVKTAPLTAEKDTVIKGQKIDSQETKKKNEKQLKETLMTWFRFKVNRDWALGLVTCEFLNAFNIVFQFYLLDVFFKGQFYDLGSKWINGDPTVLESVFPKMTKCTFHKYGPSGSIQNHDALCVMALNIINQVIYVILWFWFVILLTLTILGLFWRLLTLVLHSRSGLFNRLVWGEVSPGPALKRKEIEVIATKLTFPDWLFLYYLGKNMDGQSFRRVVGDLTTSLTTPLLNLRESDKSNLNNESYC